MRWRRHDLWRMPGLRRGTLSRGLRGARLRLQMHLPEPQVSLQAFARPDVDACGWRASVRHGSPARLGRRLAGAAQGRRGGAEAGEGERQRQSKRCARRDHRTGSRGSQSGRPGRSAARAQPRGARDFDPRRPRRARHLDRGCVAGRPRLLHAGGRRALPQDRAAPGRRQGTGSREPRRTASGGCVRRAGVSALRPADRGSRTAAPDRIGLSQPGSPGRDGQGRYPPRRRLAGDPSRACWRTNARCACAIAGWW